MNAAQAMLGEFDQEMASTRKMLERIPEDKLDWRPHPKSNTIGWNANHIAEMVEWLNGTLTTESFDVAPPGQPRYQSPTLGTRREILDLFNRNVAAARNALASATDEQMAQPWSLKEGGREFFTLPRSAVIRSFVLNHIIHHRAILCVYLRLNDVPVPGMYGPSGDDA